MTRSTGPVTTAPSGRAAGLHRWRRALLLALALLVASPTAALADPARPTNYVSTVTDVVPASAGVAVTIVGGDAFLELTVADGTEVVVLGYGDGDTAPEPYLRTVPGGGFEVNVNSPAHHLNEDRFALATPPPGVDAAAAPRWQQASSTRTHRWHDHRVHWMSPEPPPRIQQDPDAVQEVFTWSVPLLVDGRPTAVTGRLEWRPDRTLLAPLAAVAVGLLAGLAALWSGRTLRRAGGVAAASAALLLLVGLGEVAAPGAEAGAALPRLVLPVVALVLAVATTVGRARRGAATALVAAAAVLVGVGLSADVLVRPVLPTVLPDLLAWAGSGAAAGLALAAMGGALGGGTRHPDRDGTRPDPDATGPGGQPGAVGA